MNHQRHNRFKVGIDLGPANTFDRAPGTARLVQEQARALFRLAVPWEWVPTVDSRANPLWPEVESHSPLVVPGGRQSIRVTFGVGTAWQKAGCRLGFATAFLVPWNGPPTVTNFFDSNIFEHGQTWISSGRWKSYLLLQCLCRHALRRAKRLFVLSQYCHDYLARAFPHCAARLVTIPCGLNRLPLPPPDDQRPTWVETLGRPFCLYVGAFSDNKNQPALLRAWAALQAKHSDFPGLVLAGPCDQGYRKRRIDPLLSTLPRPGDVVLPGLVTDTDLAWAFHNAAFYVQPSIAEGFGMPVLEAMSHDLPVACSRSTSLPEVAGDAAVYFNPHDVQSIEAAVSTLWQDGTLREVCRRRGRERCAQFTWEANARKVAGEIESLLKTT